MQNKLNLAIKLFLSGGLLLCLSVFSFSINPYVSKGEDTILLQGFYWTSCKTHSWWHTIEDKADEIAASGFDIVWLPPSSDSLSCEGYMPRRLYVQDSKYGGKEELKKAISSLRSKGVKVIADLVLNHRVGTKDWADFTDPKWGPDSVCSDDEWGKGKGEPDTGKGFHAARDIDHTKKYVRESVINWLGWLKSSSGYSGWRYDYARGIAPKYFRIYNEATSPVFSVAEIWDDLDISNPDSHRQALCDWMNSAGGEIKVFDFTTKGVLQYALRNNQYWRLRDKYGSPSGLIGWWPGNAVTFIDNHDTAQRGEDGSVHKSWPFPSNKVLMGYAYILTHPGVPCVFWPHFFDWGIKDGIKELIRVRKGRGINSASRVNIVKASSRLYCAIIDGKIAVKLGFDYWIPGSGWEEIAAGYGYKIWVKK